jgi:hypothetical protein
MMYGSSRQGGARQVLRAAVEREAMGLAGRAIGTALDESVDPVKGGMLALRVIEAAGPSDSATLMLSTEEAIQDMSLAELLAFAAAHGIEPIPPEALPAPSESGDHGLPRLPPLRRTRLRRSWRVPPNTVAIPC